MTADDAWQEYLSAAQQLDAVRREAATAAGAQARGVHAAREELTGVRARLVPQQSRLRALGVPEAELVPSEPEVAAVAQAISTGPEAVRAALRQARVNADAADAATRLPGSGPLLARPDTWWQLLLVGAVGLALVAVAVALCLGGLYLLR